MKKYIIIVFLLIVNIIFLFQKIVLIEDKKTDINLDSDELGMLFFNNSILFSLNKKNIIYIIKYDNELINSIEKLNLDIDYLVMNKDYDINIGIKKIIDEKITLNNIKFEKNIITYKNNTLCLEYNEKCNYNYDIDDEILRSNKKVYKLDKNKQFLLKINVE